MTLRKIIYSLINYVRSKIFQAKYSNLEVPNTVDPNKVIRYCGDIPIAESFSDENIRLKLFDLIASDCKMYSTLYRKRKGVVRKDSVGVRINGIRQPADVLVISNFFGGQMRSIGRYFRLNNKVVFDCATDPSLFPGLDIEEFGTYMLIQFYRENYE